jgi:transposase InsO family protein
VKLGEIEERGKTGLLSAYQSRVTSRIARTLVVDAEGSLAHRGGQAKFLHHSGRGSQFASNEYQLLLARENSVGSMSERGNCYNDAVAKAFFHTLEIDHHHHHRSEGPPMRKRVSSSASRASESKRVRRQCRTMNVKIAH